MDHPSIVLAAKLSLDPIEHRLFLTGARAGKGAKPVRALSLLLIILSTEARIATDLLTTSDVASVTNRRRDALFLQKLTTTIAIDGGIVCRN
jgi:hypothetical protein